MHLDRITLRSVPNTRMSAFASIDVVDINNRTRLDKPQQYAVHATATTAAPAT